MKLETELSNGHKLVGETTTDGKVEIYSVGPDGESTSIGVYYPPELAEYESEDILGDEELSEKAGDLLLKLGRNWR